MSRSHHPFLAGLLVIGLVLNGFGAAPVSPPPAAASSGPTAAAIAS